LIIVTNKSAVTSPIGDLVGCTCPGPSSALSINPLYKVFSGIPQPLRSSGTQTRDAPAVSSLETGSRRPRPTRHVLSFSVEGPTGGLRHSCTKALTRLTASEVEGQLGMEAITHTRPGTLRARWRVEYMSGYCL